MARNITAKLKAKAAKDKAKTKKARTRRTRSGKLTVRSDINGADATDPLSAAIEGFLKFLPANERQYFDILELRPATSRPIGAVRQLGPTGKDPKANMKALRALQSLLNNDTGRFGQMVAQAYQSKVSAAMVRQWTEAALGKKFEGPEYAGRDIVRDAVIRQGKMVALDSLGTRSKDAQDFAGEGAEPAHKVSKSQRGRPRVGAKSVPFRTLLTRVSDLLSVPKVKSRRGGVEVGSVGIATLILATEITGKTSPYRSAYMIVDVGTGGDLTSGHPAAGPAFARRTGDHKLQATSKWLQGSPYWWFFNGAYKALYERLLHKGTFKRITRSRKLTEAVLAKDLDLKAATTAYWLRGVSEGSRARNVFLSPRGTLQAAQWMVTAMESVIDEVYKLINIEMSKRFPVWQERGRTTKQVTVAVQIGF